MSAHLHDTFAQMVAETVARHGEKTAFKDERRALGYLEFAAEVSRLGDALARRGLKRGDRVAIVAKNSIEVAVLLTLAAVGLVPVPINWRLNEGAIQALLEDCRPAALFFDGEHQAIAASQRETMLTAVIGDSQSGLSYETLLAEGACSPLPAAAPDDLCFIIYTSGTTGAPKGVEISQRAAARDAYDIATQVIDFKAEDVTLMVMPLFHVGGILYYLFPSFAAGSTTVIMQRFETKATISAIERHGITQLHVVPTMLADLLADPRMIEAAKSLRRIKYAASSIPVALLRHALDVLKCEFVQSYGSTEAGAITMLGPQAHVRAAKNAEEAALLVSCGLPLRDTEVRIENPEEETGVGEIWVRSAKTMRGIFGDPEAFARRRDGEWISTGDMGYFDANGYLYIVDRKNDMVVSGGENIFPSEIEAALGKVDGVAEVAVFGMPDPKWVERLVAAVVLESGAGLRPADIMTQARKTLSGYKVPKQVFIVETLPKNAVGKVLRKDLRKQFQNEIAGS